MTHFMPHYWSASDGLFDQIPQPLAFNSRVVQPLAQTSKLETVGYRDIGVPGKQVGSQSQIAGKGGAESPGRGTGT